MKTLIRKSTGSWVTFYMGELYDSIIPHVLSGEATLELIKNYKKNFEGIEIDLSDIEIVEVEVNIKK